MRTKLNGLITEEKGAALVLTLVLLLIGGLIIAPLLGHMGTGHTAGQVHEKRMDELYAADAGVEDAIWKIHNPDDVEGWPQTECNDSAWENPFEYSISDVNGRQVWVAIMYLGGHEYQIASEASANGSGTEIVARTVNAYSDYRGITDYILVAKEGDLDDIKGGVILDHPDENGPYPNYPGPWPTPSDLEEFYGHDVDTTSAYNPGEIDIRGSDLSLEPLYVSGDLSICNSVSTPKDFPTPTLTLTGTLYITGDTTIKSTQDMIIELDGNTIFVSSDTVGSHNALEIGKGVMIKGPGAIVAVGDIWFEPNRDVGGLEGPIFIMSVIGKTEIRPGITMYGAIAGHVDVTIQSGNEPYLAYPRDGFPPDLNFPGFIFDKYKCRIESWTIILE